MCLQDDRKRRSKPGCQLVRVARDRYETVNRGARQQPYTWHNMASLGINPYRKGSGRVLLLAALLLLVVALSACIRQPAVPTGVLYGTVALESGTPASGATLTLMAEPGGAALPTRTVTADTGGAFRFNQVRAGQYWLTALAGTAHGALLSDVNVEENVELVLNVTLLGTGTVQGAAVRGDRPADGGVNVRLTGTPLTTTTGANGAYELVGVPAGTFDLHFALTGYDPAQANSVLVTSGATTLVPNVVLQRVAPYAQFNLTQVGTTISVDASGSYDPGGNIVRYTWDFGDGTRIAGDRLITHTHQYTRSGTWTVSLTVLNQRGNSDTARATVTTTLPQLLAGRSHDVVVPANSNAHFDVVVPVGLSGNVLYLEAEGATSVQVSRGTDVFFSTAAGTFRRLGPGASVEWGDDDAALTPASINVARVCRGACVLLPRAGGVATLTIHNPGASALPVRVHLPVEPFHDLNEPNGLRSQATPLTDLDSGAIELVGDVDWFQVTRSGTLTFDAPSPLNLQATLIDPQDGPFRTLRNGEWAGVLAGDLVEVRAVQPEAGPSGVSTYHLTLQ